MTPVSDTLTVGIDIGTTSVKAVAVDSQGHVVGGSRIVHPVITSAPGYVEHDARRAWRRGPLRALASVVPEGAAVAGVGLSAMVPSMTAVDSRGVPFAPGLLYGDVRGERTGICVASDCGLPDIEGQLRWTASKEPGAQGYWPAQAVASFALCGVPAVDSAVAMAFGRLRLREEWQDGLLGEVGAVSGQMPVVAPMGDPVGTVRSLGAPLCAGSVDALCDQIVSGAVNDGDVLVIFGATLVMWAVVTGWPEVPGYWTVPHTAAGKTLIGGPSNAGALFVDWARGLLGPGLRGSSVSAAGRRGRSEGGGEALPSDPRQVPVWLPYVRGERVPFHDPGLSASLHGMDITQGAGALQRAAYEAGGFVLRRMLECSGVEARRIVASGSGSRNAAWMQAVADCTGLPVDLPAVPEGAALGAAFMARMAAGLETTVDAAGRWARVNRRIEPCEPWKIAADGRFAAFKELSPKC
ncbi:MAG: xylulokinase [Acidimicrobiales bacterium]